MNSKKVATISALALGFCVLVWHSGSRPIVVDEPDPIEDEADTDDTAGINLDVDMVDGFTENGTFFRLISRDGGKSWVEVVLDKDGNIVATRAPTDEMLGHVDEPGTDLEEPEFVAPQSGKSYDI